MVAQQLVTLLCLCVVFLASSGHAGKECIDDIDGQVYTDGQEYYRQQEPCVKYKCKNGVSSVSETECRHPDETLDDCFKVGSKMVANCITRECLDGDGGRIFYVTELMCSDADGNCHDVGSRFSKVIGDKKREGCTCDANGDTVDYRCD